MADARSLTEHLKPHERIILAYDIGRFNEFEKMQLEKLLPYVGMVKIGYQAIFTRSLFTTMALEVSHCVGTSSTPSLRISKTPWWELSRRFSRGGFLPR